jgi:acetylornithine deacetylase
VSTARTNVDDVSALLERLVAIDSVNPTLVPGGSGEAAIARFVAEWLDRQGVAVEYQELAPGRANVIGRVRGTGGARTLLLNAHLDTVGLGGEDAGLVPRIEGGRMYGRGAYDMKGGLAAIMLAAAATSGRSHAGDLVIAAVADEEAFSIGTEALVKTVRADAAIVTEPTELRLAIAHKGFVWLEIETSGVAAHGSRYDLGIDAIALMGHILVGVGDLDERLREGELHPLLGGASLHASLIEGGQELSTYPESCLVRAERRTLPGEGVDLVEEQLQAIAAPLGAAVKTLFSREPLETGPDEPIVTTLLEQATAVLGQAPEIIGVPYWTDAGLLGGAGIPVVVFGPGGAGAHAEVEWGELEDIAKCVDVLVATADAFCS